MGVAKAALIAVCLAFLGSVFSGCSFKNYGDELFELRRAASGKDVMWLPTKAEMAHAMLKAADVGPADIVYDLGSGDGVIPIQAASLFGVRAVGIEYNADLVALSDRNAKRAGVENLVTFKKGDIFVEDFSSATVVTLYLGEALNNRLMPKILSMRAGTRVVSNTFRMEAWAPDREIRLPSNEIAFLWVVPAAIDGSWRVHSSSIFDGVRLNIRQKKQFFDGQIELVTKERIAIEDGEIRASEVRFRFNDSQGNPLSFVGTVVNEQVIGDIRDRIGNIVTFVRIDRQVD